MSVRAWLFFAAVGGLVGCGDDGGIGTGGSGTGASGAGASGAGASGGAGGDTGGGGGEASCADAPNEGDCFECCNVANDAAFTELNELFIELCICGVGAACETECAAECADPNLPLGMVCDTCVTAVNEPDNPDQCVIDTIDDCGVSTTCSPLFDCWDTC